MTHGYENEYFLDEIKCLVNNGCLTRYPRDGICHGNDNDGIANLKSLDQVSNCIKIAEVVCFSGQNSSRMPTTTSSDFCWEKQTTTFEVIYLLINNRRMFNVVTDDLAEKPYIPHKSLLQ